MSTAEEEIREALIELIEREFSKGQRYRGNILHYREMMVNTTPEMIL